MKPWKVTVVYVLVLLISGFAAYKMKSYQMDKIKAELHERCVDKITERWVCK